MKSALPYEHNVQIAMCCSDLELGDFTASGQVSESNCKMEFT